MLMYVLGALALVLTIVFIVVRVKWGGLIGVYTKTLASVGFLTLGLFGIYTNGATLPSIFIVLGLLFGLIGDIVLDLKIVYKQDNDHHLNAGMISFLLGHIMYFIALTIIFVNQFASKLWIGLLIAAIIALVFTVCIMLLAKPLLKLEFGKFKTLTAIYTFALVFMTAYAFVGGAFNSQLMIFAVGLLLFLLSDLVLSNQYFGTKANDKLFTIINHALYYLAQITIAVAIYFL